MRLSLYSFIPESLVASLQEIGIRTDSELMFSKTPVEILRLLPSGTVSMQDLQNYITRITAEASAIGVRGDHLLALEDAKREQKKALDLGTGVQRLDALLGDLADYTLLEVSGEKGSGKTVKYQLLIQGAPIYTITWLGIRFAYCSPSPHPKPYFRCTLDGHHG